MNQIMTKMHNVVKIETRNDFFGDIIKEKEFYTKDFIFTDKNGQEFIITSFSKEKLEIKEIKTE